jgi:uroporphyrin-III C-methyltransferase
VSSGRVVLVGAGPADPELITVKGLAWLRRADVVVHDRLIGPALLDEAPTAALRIYAGKSSGRHCIPQSAISPILIHHARAGRIVVRLKGGDPFVFGRGGEEVLACRAAGVPVEMVPGVSSAVAAPAAAGIPVTHRGLASSFAVVTGHEDPAKPEATVNWEALAGSVDTLVVLMGVGALPAIAARLVAAGRPATTPVAVVGQGTSPEQQIVLGTLADIGRRARHVAPPATIVVGEVVRLAEAALCHHRAGEPAGYEAVRDPARVGRASTARRPRCPPR